MPPHGACLLGSINLVKYVVKDVHGKYYFDYAQLRQDLGPIVRAMDNIVDRAIYPLPAQRESALSKRRMGLGYTGLANAGEALGFRYGSPEFLAWHEEFAAIFMEATYMASVELAKEKGPFPLFDAELYLQSEFASKLPEHVREAIRKHGIRNSHLLSIAPTGTISNVADNVSSGIEPPFSLFYDRVVRTFEGEKTERVSDYAYREWGIEGATALTISAEDHVKVLCLASKYVDSACSKTINIGDDVSWEDFKHVYLSAYEGGASGCTTFRAAGKRAGILTAAASEEVVEEVEEVVDTFINEKDLDVAGACVWDPITGIRSCE